MKKPSAFRFWFLVVFVGFLLGFSANNITAQNAISGMVFDYNRRPISDINVELLDDVERLIATRKTIGGGFYSFQKLNQGIYYIRIRVAGTGYKKKKIRIDLGDLNSIGGVDLKQVDVFLQLDPRLVSKTPPVIGVIFAQEIPKDAKRSYENGIKNLDKKRNDEATIDFSNSLKIFPEYFDALFRLGDIYLTQGKFVEAENALKRAIIINPKSAPVLYGLAIAQNRLKKRHEAIENLKKGVTFDGSSINSYLLLGKIQRDLMQYKEAEKSFLKAKKLGTQKAADVNWNLALLYYHDLKKFREAADELELYLSNLSKRERKKNIQKVSMVKKLIKNIRSGAK